MTDATQAILLQRMTRRQNADVVENPLTSSRAVRLALTKAANDTVGLSLSVLSVAEDITPLDDMLTALDDELMLVGLLRADRVIGMIALDMQLRAAVLEMETMGAVIGQAAEARAPTRTDTTLSAPLIAAFLAAFPAAVHGTTLEGWGNDLDQGDRIDSRRVAGLVLDDGHYRIIRMVVDLGVADRQGALVMALPLVDTPEPAAPAPPPPPQDWETAFQAGVGDAAARLDALLHRFKIPLSVAQSLQVGSILPLSGCSVHSVRLLAPDGQIITQAKLGQIGGMRAVRLQQAPAVQLAELAPAHPADMSDMIDNDGTSADVSLPDLPRSDAPQQEADPATLDAAPISDPVL